MWYAACELCRQSQFSPQDVTAFTVRNKQIEFVELHGRDPWSGVRVICDQCVGRLIPILELRVAYQRGRADRAEAARDRLKKGCEATITALDAISTLVEPFPETEETLAHFLVKGKIREIVEAAIKGSADDAKGVEG